MFLGDRMGILYLFEYDVLFLFGGPDGLLYLPEYNGRPNSKGYIEGAYLFHTPVLQQ
jgi:hypothetical protein